MKHLNEAIKITRALNRKHSKSIIKVLSKKPLNVTQIYTKLKIEQEVASQHLTLLKSIGLVKSERQGKFIYYSIIESRLEQLSFAIGFMIQDKKRA